MRPIASLKLGEWVLRERIADGNTQAVRLIDAVNELESLLPINEYPSRLTIAQALADGKTLTVGFPGKTGKSYRYQLADTGVPIAGLLKAAKDALALLKTVQAKDIEASGEYDAMPYAEIVALEDAISEVELGE